MTLPTVIRIFFAIDLPSSSKDQIGNFILLLKKKSKTHGIRWSKPENLHITLQFLAEVRTEHLANLIQEAKANLQSVLAPTALSFGAVKLFPNPFRPRVIVLDVAPQERLATLSKLLGQCIQTANYEIETRPFRAHLTLGRIKQPQGMELGFLTEAGPPDLTPVEINDVVLFRSEPQTDGSKYSVIEKIKLS